MIARDFEGKEIHEGDKAIWASKLGNSPVLQYRHIVKVEGKCVWTSKEIGGRVTKVIDNSKLCIIGNKLN